MVLSVTPNHYIEKLLFHPFHPLNKKPCCLGYQVYIYIYIYIYISIICSPLFYPTKAGFTKRNENNGTQAPPPATFLLPGLPGRPAWRLRCHFCSPDGFPESLKMKGIGNLGCNPTWMSQEVSKWLVNGL